MSIHRAQGVTGSERHLKKLCDHSFLSFWSYSGIYRDQGDAARGGDGKEICDLLVVCGNHVLIFSDKDCVFPNTGNLELDWSRWYRRAIKDSAAQIFGAEKWIRNHPDRIFLDKSCQQRFPIDLPSSEDAIFHRIIVAHGASKRCKEKLGGSGSLMIFPDVIGDAHCLPVSKGGVPFAVGQVNPQKGFVHILDDTTLDILLRTLDTITDFVSYLIKKEKFILSGKLGAATGEEELLAYYLGKLNQDREHDFVLSESYDKLLLDEGHWDEFLQSVERKSQIEADKISYAWDELIEKFLSHVYAGTQHHTTHPGIENFPQQEKIFRLCAKEPRTKRRALAKALLDLVYETPENVKAARVFFPKDKNGTYYVFLLLPYLPGMDTERYREVRREHLIHYCMVTKLMFPEANDIIGIATETGANNRLYTSEDIVYYDASFWTPEEEAEARSLQKDLNILLETKQVAVSEKDYPSSSKDRPTPKIPEKNSILTPNLGRRRPCHCGSGRKYKNCCERKFR
jgi:hypothetical protein